MYVRGEGALPLAGVDAAASVRVVEVVDVVVGREDALEDLQRACDGKKRNLNVMWHVAI